MTVSSLVMFLQNHDPDLEVFIDDESERAPVESVVESNTINFSEKLDRKILVISYIQPIQPLSKNQTI